MRLSVKRWGWTWLQQPEDAWRLLSQDSAKIDELEERIKKLEK